MRTTVDECADSTGDIAEKDDGLAGDNDLERLPAQASGEDHRRPEIGESVEHRPDSRAEMQRRRPAMSERVKLRQTRSRGAVYSGL